MIMAMWWLAAEANTGAFDFARVLSTASPPLMLAIFILMLSARKLILPRELERAEQRIAELIVERDEYKHMAFDALRIGEQVASAVGKPRR